MEGTSFVIGTYRLLGISTIVVTLAATAWAQPPLSIANRNPPLATADLLVDLARDRGLGCQGEQTDRDVLRIRTLLQAALRLNPEHGRALTWLCELAQRGGDEQATRDYLARLTEVDPGNVTAFSNWLDLGPANVQTIEQRRAWLVGLLAETTAQRNALVLVRLAAVSWRQGDAELARQYLTQARQTWPACPEAAVLRLEMLTTDMPLAERVDALLRAIELDPLRASYAWELAVLLDEHGFSSEALEFFQYALDLYQHVGGGDGLSVGHLLELSRNALARGDGEAGLELAQRAARHEFKTDHGFEARFFLHWLLKGRAPEQYLRQAAARLGARFAEIDDPDKAPIERVAQAGWFYCTLGADPTQAMLMADSATRRAPGDVFATRVLGWAQILSGRVDEGRATLEPIAKQDPYAAFQLARLALEDGDEAAASRYVRELEYVPRLGQAHDLLNTLGLLPTTQPATTEYPAVPGLLAGFHRDVMNFYRATPDYLAAEIKLERPSLIPGEPWWATFTITNTGSFPITLGPDAMVNPVFLLSFVMEGDMRRTFPNLMTIAIEQERSLRPGESVSVRRTIDLGPLRTVSRRTPQHLQSVTMTAVLDPVQTASGRWRPSVTGLDLRPVIFARVPVHVSAEAWNAWFSSLREGTARQRFETVELLGELLLESQRAALDKLSYRPTPILEDRVYRALMNALGSDDWETRVRTIEAVQHVGLDRGLLAAVRQCLDHEHWLVRLMAVRLLARQGEVFAETAWQLADNDPDELVRDMARSYAMNWPEKDPAARQPEKAPATPGE